MRDRRWIIPIAAALTVAAATSSLVIGCLSAGGGSALKPRRVDPEALFETSDRCLACHNGLTAANGDDASIGTRWRSTIMAHSSKDPYWHAGVRREVLEHPRAREAIEDKCSTCHMPMARFVQRESGKRGEVLAHVESGLLGMDSRIETLVEDGVSCTVCHQMTADRLVGEKSFDGGFAVDTLVPLDERRIFGPFSITAATAKVMRSATGFVPTEATHLKRSELCAPCHTLFTHALDGDGRAVARLAEQVPYLEWLHSDYKESQSCQDCHMKTHASAAPISSVLGKPRQGVVQHLFKGGNFLLLRLLDKHRQQLGVSAPSGELEANRQTIVEHLTSDAASLTIETGAAALAGGQLALTVQVENRAGHKLPTAYPSRRVWLHVTVKDARGQLVFESGALNDDGSIRGNDNDADPRRYEPHYREITAPHQVQIYESIMGDPRGRVTTGLLSAATYLKDNRIPPAGFDKATASADVAVVGAARQDDDFAAGRDKVVYRVGTAGAEGPFFVTAELWYQPIGHRWAMNLASVGGAEPRRFVAMYRAMPGRETAVRLTEARASVARLAPSDAPPPTQTKDKDE
jgi:hypothetical protein